ncbi:C4-dicarboxylate ABC transporter substrate-binding protein [Polynucleobacter sp. QLW-P1DATA-2]|jgi:tripartite-type tricarboxylate transporter receptor subunit TctC|uniref:tripartite tricarboxylate transporter substrate binding protein n=1 Tax=unclassified Polynucleobacter TaxID=2640945 RepID=UPI0008F82C8D|nr:MULTISPECIES: tripartite tricarboxylate transporter substrate binding protein [unclassified Polynucleobacter]OIM98446.1 C4-dicarboxylate ABC transporter substrate-binding protein [Polynucleobacter sp. MWH-Tro8-2-5-gr]OIN00353.1 C4-dicarboxylate ABC transporter substrate-binding protein [Polynucleobacter sp. QLW-P1DATA-2]
MKLLWKILCSLVISALSLGLLSIAQAQPFPDKTIQYIIPFPPAGESDLVARYQAEISAKKFKQPMIVINRAGAGGALTWSALNTYPADGTTVVGVNVPHTILQPLQEGIQYKTEDINAIYYYHFTPDALMVSADSPYKTFQEFIAAAKKDPGKLTLAGSGQYSANHMAVERLNRLVGVKIAYVPFKGTGDLVTSLIGMHVDGAMGYLPLAIQQKGKVRTLAIATEKRNPALPDVPTFKELGLNWVDGAYRGVAVPKATPLVLQQKMSDYFAQLNADPETKKKLEESGFVLVDIPLAKMPAFMKEKTAQSMDDARNAGMIK